MQMNKTNPEFTAFTSLMNRLLSVPHSVIQERVEEHRKRAAKNPNRPGPKRKPAQRRAGRASRAKG